MFTSRAQCAHFSRKFSKWNKGNNRCPAKYAKRTLRLLVYKVCGCTFLAELPFRFELYQKSDMVFKQRYLIASELFSNTG